MLLNDIVVKEAARCSGGTFEDALEWDDGIEVLCRPRCSLRIKILYALEGLNLYTVILLHT